MSVYFISASPPSTPPRASGGAASDFHPPNPKDKRDEKKYITSIDKVCEEIDIELKKLIPNDWIELWWTCTSSYSTDFVPSSLAETGNDQIFGITRADEIQSFPCDAVIKYQEVGGTGGIYFYEQAFTNVCKNRTSVSGRRLFFESDPKIQDAEPHHKDIDEARQEILKLWESASAASADVKSKYGMFGVIVIGFSELPTVVDDDRVNRLEYLNSLRYGDVGQQIAFNDAKKNMEF